ncbi:DNA adenine methylase [Holdemanella porci]|uniref:DNA adenine methylase n=1 Tax=Holdemanella porci TaxID=2652276 RepID=UPI003F8ED42B
MIQSPLNYTGGKFKLLPQILPLFPSQIDCFVDLFCGGCNVGINVSANRYVYNDSCEPLINLYSVMQTMKSEVFLSKVEKLIQKYDLSNVKLNGYEFYNCSSADGLGSYNKEKYLMLRSDFNSLSKKDSDYYVMLYVLIVFAFNNQIRFNSSGKFNLPIGKRDFNQNMYKKLNNFLSLLHSQNAIFTHKDFRNFDISKLTPNDFVYVDPPYLITCAAYNEQGGWTENDEMDLLRFLDGLSKKNIRFALSNVLEAKGNVNQILKHWIENRTDYTMIDLNYSYNNSSYHRQKKKYRTREILVVNY